MRRTLPFAVAATMAGLVAAGCATAHGAGGRPHAISIEVNNNHTVPTGIDVYITGPARTESYLGYVPGGKGAVFSYRPDSYGQRYRLIAKRQLERPVASTYFTFGDAQTRLAHWDLIPGVVIVYDQTGPEPQNEVADDTTQHGSTH
jgi:hypothetical protein